MNIKTVYDYYTCREVCYVIVTNNGHVIGGGGKIVQIDESHKYTRKYNRGRLLKNERKQILEFGGIQKDNCFIMIVEIKIPVKTQVRETPKLFLSPTQHRDCAWEFASVDDSDIICKSN